MYIILSLGEINMSYISLEPCPIFNQTEITSLRNTVFLTQEFPAHFIMCIFLLVLWIIAQILIKQIVCLVQIMHGILLTCLPVAFSDMMIFKCWSSTDVMPKPYHSILWLLEHKKILRFRQAIKDVSSAFFVCKKPAFPLLSLTSLHCVLWCSTLKTVI